MVMKEYIGSKEKSTMRHKIVNKIVALLAFMFICSLGTILNAQNPSTLIYGIVQDEYGKPISGAMVKSSNGKNLALTNVNGEYKLVVDDNSNSLNFSIPGYIKKTESIAEKNQIDVQLKAGGHNMEIGRAHV